MGFFSGDRQISVDSVVYNMAGPEEHRPNYLKSLVVRNILSGTKDGMGETLQNGYINGPAMKFRAFYRWAEKPENFGQIGMPTGALAAKSAINNLVVQDAITDLTGQSSWVQRAELRAADYGIWVEQWLLQNSPSTIGTAWSADINDAGTLITITFADTSTTSFVPVNFDPAAQYLYAWYTPVSSSNIGPLVPGDVIELGTDPFPSISGWTYEGQTVDGSSTEWVYSRMVYIGAEEEGARYRRDIMHHLEETDPELDRSYWIDEQTYTGLDHQQVKLFIYKIGSGNAALDAMASDGDALGQFFPFIPVRINNAFLSESYYPDVYAQVKKAYRKATGSSLSSFIEKLEDNPDLNDIDYAYIAFGVSLNVVENSCKRYLYAFFEKLQLSQVGGPSIYTLWKDAVESQESIFTAWQTWKNAQDNSADPLYATEEPQRPVLPTMPGNEIRVAGTSPALFTNYDTRLNWLYIDDGSGLGLAKPEAKAGDLWFQTLPPDEFVTHAYGGVTLGGVTSSAMTVSRIRLYWQRTASSYTYLDIVGLTHSNYIYASKGVITSAAEALADPDESCFIVPLHYDTWRETAMIHASQMGTACVFAVFNCYEVKKQRWYQSSVFSILLVIVVAILSVIFTGGAGFGLLGTHMAVGAVFGLTGISAAIVGSIANALAALVLVTVIQKSAGALFGEAIGAVIAAIAMFAIGSGLSSYHTTGQISFNWGDLLKADNLLKMTFAFGNAYAAHLQEGAMKIATEMEEFVENAKLEADKIQQAFFAEFGYGGGKIDPMMFVDVASTSRILAESSDTFLKRTLMTGTDIVELSQDLLYNFPEYSIKLPDAYS